VLWFEITAIDRKGIGLELGLLQANSLITEVLKAARNKNMPPIAVAVLDTGAHLKALQREDGVSFLRVQIAQAKAWGALGMATNSGLIADRYNQDDLQKGFINALNTMTGGQVVPLPGGVLVRDGAGEIIGAIGAAGGVSTDDEACVIAAIEAIGFGYRLI
jgi:uncharacterized protein GlcG (DUF336 family)